MSLVTFKRHKTRSKPLTIKVKHNMFDRVRATLIRYDQILIRYTRFCSSCIIFHSPLNMCTRYLQFFSGNCTQFTSSTFESSKVQLLVSQVQVPSNGLRRRVCPSKIQMKFLPFWMLMVVTLGTVFGRKLGAKQHYNLSSLGPKSIKTTVFL